MGEMTVYVYLLAGYVFAGVLFWFAVEHYRRDFGMPLEITDAILVALTWPIGIIYVLKLWLARLLKS